MRLLVGGPPNSGKSTVTAALVQLLRRRPTYRDTTETVDWISLDPIDTTLAGLLGESVDRPDGLDSEEFTEEVARSVRQRWVRNVPLVIGDAPGLVDEKTETIAEPADAILYVVSDRRRSELAEREELADRVDLDVYGTIETTLNETVEPAWTDRRERCCRIRSVHNGEFEAAKTDAYDQKTRRILKQIAVDLLGETP